MNSTATSTQALEIQYNNQRRVPEFPELMQDWVQRTQALRASTGARLDIAYGDGERERLDLYPARNEDAPLLVFISLLMGHPMTLEFNHPEIIAMVAASVIAALVAIDARSNWFEGAMLLGVFFILAIGFFFIPEGI